MNHEDEVYPHDENSDFESTHDAHESDPRAKQEPEDTNEEPQPEETDEKKQGKSNKSRPGAATQKPNNYPAQPSPQQFPQQFPPQPAYYPTAHPVQAPPQHFPPQVSPHQISENGFKSPHEFLARPLQHTLKSTVLKEEGKRKVELLAQLEGIATVAGDSGSHPYGKAPPTSPYTPAAASPGINYQNGAPAMYQNGGYAHAPQMNGNPAAGYPTQSPYVYRPPAPGNVGWSTGLFDCMDDPNNALITACCPCFTFGQIAEIVDSGQTTCATSGILYGCIAAFTLLPCLISCTYRTKMRSQYDLVELPAADWITHIFCEWCALCQEYRELTNRGIDPAIGWHGNMMRNQQQPQVAMMPPANQTMQGPYAF